MYVIFLWFCYYIIIIFFLFSFFLFLFSSLEGEEDDGSFLKEEPGSPSELSPGGMDDHQDMSPSSPSSASQFHPASSSSFSPSSLNGLNAIRDGGMGDDIIGSRNNNNNHSKGSHGPKFFFDENNKMAAAAAAVMRFPHSFPPGAPPLHRLPLFPFSPMVSSAAPLGSHASESVHFSKLDHLVNPSSYDLSQLSHDRLTNQVLASASSDRGLDSDAARHGQQQQTSSDIAQAKLESVFPFMAPPRSESIVQGAASS